MFERNPLKRGQMFGEIEVIEYKYSKPLFNSGYKHYYLCYCHSCKNECIVEKNYLMTSKIKCCKELPIDQYKTEIKLRRTLQNMKIRCYNINSKEYKNYGGRGITVCEEWKNSFINFYDWSIHNGFQNNLTIDRIDNNKGYSPDNCRWVDFFVQGGNKRNNHLLTYKGKTQHLDAWAREYGLDRKFLQSRINNYNMTLEEALNTPKKFRYKILTFNNKSQNIKDWAKEMNLTEQVIYYRINNGWDVEKALTTPLLQQKIDKNYTYKSETLCLKELSRKYNVNYGTLKSRIKKGWAIEKAIETPIRTKNIEK